MTPLVGLGVVTREISGPPEFAPRPVSGREVGVASLSANVSVAVRFPGAVGLKATFNEHVAWDAKLNGRAPQLMFENTNSEALAPETVRFVTVRVPPPALVMVRVPFSVWPTIVGVSPRGKAEITGVVET